MPRSSTTSRTAAAPRGAHRQVPGWPPRWLTPYTAAEATAGDGPILCEFVETFCRIDKDSLGGRRGELIRLRPFQQHLFAGLLARRADGRRKHRIALIGEPRKNGKSGLGSGLALFGLLGEGDGAEVYSVAGDKKQAGIVFRSAKQMVQLDPELSAMVDRKELRLYKDAIEVPGTGSVYRVLSSVADLQEGLNPSLVVFDEVHVQPDEELWDVMTLAIDARVDPLVAGITTAGKVSDRRGQDTLCFRLYKHLVRVARGELTDPSFFGAWWEPAQGMKADHRDPRVWAEANPGLGDLVAAEGLASAVKRTRESEFRTKRLNIWTAGEESWLPFGAWDTCAAPHRRPPAPGTDVVLGFDGSHSRDSTAIVGATVGGDYVWLVEAWERPVGGDGQPLVGWKVPRGDVKETLRDACRTWHVLEVAYDPYRWADLMQELEAEGLPAVEFPQNAARMAPACDEMADAVLDGRVAHDGSEVLGRHVRNAVGETSRYGTRIVKENQDSERTIDSAIAAVIARARAVFYGLQDDEPPPAVWDWPDDEEMLADGEDLDTA